MPDSRNLPLRAVTLGVIAALLASCASAPARKPEALASPSAKYYLDDGPMAAPSGVDLDTIPDATPRLEPLHRAANRPYTVLGRDYVPATALKRYKERGIASWYGRKYHGQKTSTGETYDMFAMTAAHPTLPIPSYARVTNTATGKSVVVRINDRGPFLHDRLIDLSYAAAYKLGIAQRGSGEVEVESVIPGGSVTAMLTPPLPPVDGSVAATAPVVITPAVLPVPIVARNDVAPVAPAPGSDVTPASPPVRADVSAHSAAARAEVVPQPAAPGTGYTVQLGAFANYANAQAFLVHVAGQMSTAQVEPKVRQSGGLFRVYVGPYAERDEARRVGERIGQAFGFATTLSAQ